MENLEGYGLKNELMTFLPHRETVAFNSQYAVVTVIGKVDKDVDVIFQMQEAFNHFIQSGQVWALLIGIALGYIFRSFTAY